jgi:hypothetical protein
MVVSKEALLISLSFKKDNLRELLQYTNYSNAKSKDPKLIFQIMCTNLIAKKEEDREKLAEEYGLETPYLFKSIVASLMQKQIPIEEASNYLKSLFVGVDDLHVPKGAKIAFIKQLKKNHYFDWNKFKTNLEIHLKRSKLGDLDGANITKLIMKSEDIIIPSLNKNVDVEMLKNLRNIFEHFNIISWIAKQSKDVKNFDGILLLLSHECFFLGEDTLLLPNDLHVINLYLYTMIKEYPIFMRERGCLELYSCQSLEGILAKIKKLIKYTTDKHHEHALISVMEKLRYEIMSKMIATKDPQHLFQKKDINKTKHIKEYRKVMKFWKIKP